MAEPAFAKLFDTAEGQLLAYMGETDEGDAAVIIIAAPVDGVTVCAKLSGWADEGGQQRAFDKIDQAAAERDAKGLRDAVRRLGGEG